MVPYNTHTLPKLSFISVSAHVVNHILRENRNSIQTKINGIISSPKSNHLNFEFYLGKLNNKILPIWCNVNFVSVFTALNNTKKQREFNITPYGEILLLNLPGYN